MSKVIKVYYGKLEIHHIGHGQHIFSVPLEYDEKLEGKDAKITVELVDEQD